MRVYRCVLEPDDDSRSLEIPQWMFDASACCRIALSPSPAVTCEALHELRHLIESAFPSLTGTPCYKPGTLPYPIREVPVRHVRALRSADQLGLFHPRPSTVQWAHLPQETRQQVLLLLARLLRSHRHDLLGEPLGREARDE